MGGNALVFRNKAARRGPVRAQRVGAGGQWTVGWEPATFSGKYTYVIHSAKLGLQCLYRD